MSSSESDHARLLGEALLAIQSLKAELARLKKAMGDNDQLANEQLPNGVDASVAKLRGK